MIDLLEWDSAFWNVRAARVHAASVDELADVDAACRTAGIEWASLLVPTNEVEVLTHAVRSGFDVVDIRYSMRASLGPRTQPPPRLLAEPAEVDPLAIVARTALKQSRFFSDRHLADDRCEIFYETWLRNSIGGPMADAVIVERDGDGVHGFISVKWSPVEGAATLPLVAVAPDRQGRGVGRRVLGHTLDWIAAHGGVDVEVVTQLTNPAAIRLYQSAGFVLHESAVWLHRWFDDI